MLCESHFLIRFRNESPYPFCVSSPKPSQSKRVCAYTHDKIVMCNLIEHTQPLPAEYQVGMASAGIVSLENENNLDFRFSTEYHRPN